MEDVHCPGVPQTRAEPVKEQTTSVKQDGSLKPRLTYGIRSRETGAITTFGHSSYDRADAMSRAANSNMRTEAVARYSSPWASIRLYEEPDPVEEAEAPAEAQEPAPKVTDEQLENALNVNIVRVADPVDGSPFDVVSAKQLRESIEAMLAPEETLEQSLAALPSGTLLRWVTEWHGYECAVRDAGKWYCSSFAEDAGSGSLAEFLERRAPERIDIIPVVGSDA